MQTGQIQPLTVKSEKIAPQAVQRFRLLLLAAAVLFPLWAVVLRLSAAELRDPVELRLLIAGLAMAIIFASYKLAKAREHIEALVFALALVIVVVIGYEAHINHLHAAAALSYTVAAFGVALAFESQRLMLSYLIFSVVVSLFVGGSNPQVSRLLFVSANFCTLLMAGLAFHDKQNLLSRLQRRYREQELSRNILNEVQHVAKMGGWSFRLKTQTLWWSEQAYLIHEVGQKVRVTMAMALEFIAPESRDLLSAAIRDAAEKREPFELELALTTALGHPRWVRMTCKAEAEAGGDKVRRLIGSIQDITSEKQLKDELVAREFYIRAVIDAIPGFVSWTDADLNYIGVNRALAEAFQMAPQDFVGQPMGFRNTLGDEVTEFMRSLFSSDAEAANREVTINSGGVERSVLLSAKKYQDGAGAVLIGLDITARKGFERELTEQKDLLAQIVDNVPHGIYAKAVDANYSFVMWNRGLELMTGYRREDLLGQTDHALYAPHEADLQRQIDAQVAAGRRRFDQPEESWPTTKATVITHTMRVPVVNAKGETTLILGVVEDITEKKAREELIRTQQIQLMHASKMSTLGEMSGGIAHEINNPLTVIMGFASRLQQSIGQDNADLAEMRRYAERIISMTERIAKIVRGLKTFAREASQDPFEATLVHVVVNESLELCQERFINNGVRLDRPTCSEVLAFDCRPIQISQVLINLLNNAFDAVQALPEKWVRLEVKDLGDAVSFAVSDSGSGIPQEIAAKVLHPFFTTKSVGHGTGLGLSISRGIIESHRGHLYYEPTCSNTTFVFVVPKEQRVSVSPPLISAA